MGEGRRVRWVVPFLRALERTGEVQAAAEDAGIDKSSAYVRRKTHGDFAGRWDAALRAHEEFAKRAEAEEIEALKKKAPLPPEPSAWAPPSAAEGGGAELVASGGQVKRVGAGRWSQAKERIFFEELAATANATMAAKPRSRNQRASRVTGRARAGVH